MTIGAREEFILLIKYKDELSSNLRDKVVMLAERLITIRDHIELCDIITDSRIETYNLWVTFEYWEKCRQFWSKFRPYAEDIEIPEITLKTKKHPGQRIDKTSDSTALVVIEKPSQDPKKILEITPNDRIFLRSLRIAADETSDPSDDGA